MDNKQLQRRLDGIPPRDLPLRADVIYAYYTTNVAQAMAHDSYTRLDYEDLVTDTHSAVTVGASWVFTSPAPRYYTASAGYRLAASTNWSVTERCVLCLYKNSALLSILGYWTLGNNTVPSSIIVGVYGSMPLYLDKGDTLAFYCWQNSGGAINLDAEPTRNWCAIMSMPI